LLDGEYGFPAQARGQRELGWVAFCMHLPGGFLARFGKRFLEIVTIDVVEKDALAPVATAHDMANRAGILDARFARHGGDASTIS
jgi:hypothetical protein